MSGNLFELRKDWPIPPTSTSNPTIKVEPQTQEAATPQAVVILKVQKYGWGPNCPICKNIKDEEDWNGDRNLQNTPHIQSAQQTPQQSLQPQNSYNLQNLQQPQSQTQNVQHQQNNPKTFDVPGRYSNQIRLCREWEEKMEKLNRKYGLDYFADSELDSESDEGEDYRYEHIYETLI